MDAQIAADSYSRMHDHWLSERNRKPSLVPTEQMVNYNLPVLL